MSDPVAVRREVDRLHGAEVIEAIGVAQPSRNGKPDLTHDGLALQLGEEWYDRAQYVAPWGRWLFWDGVTWRQDETLEHMTRSRAFLRELADALGPDQREAARRLRSSDTVARVVGLARSNEAQAATVDQWDSDPYMIGTPEGPVCLRTGVLLRPNPEFYITKSTSVAPAEGGSPAPLWSAFLERVTGEDVQLQAYLRRFAGYCLTGDTSEHVFAFGYGSGANGKSVFINTILGIIGDYGLPVPTEMLMASAEKSHPTELARLRSVRLAVGSETEEGARFAEAKVKRLTGGDPIPARFMHKDFFEFKPQFKLFIVGNHRPSLRGVDEAIRRRLHLVPFSQTIPPEERDPELFDKLREEWPAILRWMVQGCVWWQSGGLNPPERVKAATAEYLEAEDALSIWLEECTDADRQAWESSGTLFSSWKRWAERSGEYVGSQKRFAGLLSERGFVAKRQAGTGLRGFVGLRANQPPERFEP